MDLAEAVDDLICTLDGPGDTTMDTLAMLLFGWILAALFFLWLIKIVYERFYKSQKPAAPSPDVLDTGNNVKKAPVIVPKVAGFVPPTPPVRRRLTRQSPAREVGGGGRKTRYLPAPQATGPDNVVVLWVNDVFQWLYNDFVIVNELLQVWIAALNEFTKKSVSEQGIGVELVRILPETHPPTVTNIFAEADSKDDVTITCDLDATPAFQLKSFRQKGEKVDTSHYRVDLNRFRARMNIFCVSEKLQASIKCDGWPEIKLALAPVGNIKNNLDETQLQEVISEIVTNALRNVDVHLNLAQYPTCPRLIRHVETSGRTLPLHYDSMQGNVYASTPNQLSPQNLNRRSQGEKRLLVKVIRAAQLGGQNGCAEPFCVVEMDEPAQKNQTSVKRGGESPFWDEHFLFDLSPHTAELLFEIYDHAVNPHRFLGLGIVGVEELLINPSQRQIITLQSRPYESDPVTGTLTVELAFDDARDASPDVAFYICGDFNSRIGSSNTLDEEALMGSRLLHPRTSLSHIPTVFRKSWSLSNSLYPNGILYTYILLNIRILFYEIEESDIELIDPNKGIFIKEKEHSSDINLSRQDVIRKFQCYTCNATFKTKSNLKHYSITHLNICPFESTYINTLGYFPFKCDTGKKKFKGKGDLNAHILTHSDEKNFKCNICKAEFKRKGSLKRHKLTHLDEKNFKCNICNAKFKEKCKLAKLKQKGKLKSHISTDFDSYLFECDICKAKFKGKDCLKRHKLTHYDIYLFKCDTCNAKFEHKRSLKSHILTHSDEKNFECNICNGKFKREGDLKEHILIHFRYLIFFEWDICKSKFKRKRGLKIHKLTQSGIYPFECDTCNAKFKQKHNLKSHILTQIG
ncbi:unnamed protein product [Ceutorhynchus assimilis]|uniref:C2H2-type domain-containing protein n=1 Tax=Ceutorhynchus assimilis TaxID=467358 RepID=A0A9N9Q9I1_9CUCU|nr:unnamed protein product [Ceutorhynchus assimilis]